MGGQVEPRDVVGIVFLSRKSRRAKLVEPGEKVEVQRH